MIIRRIVFFLSLLFVGFTSSAQEVNPDTINKYNADGKMHGLWIEYLTEDLVRTKEEKAVFYRYTLYHNGKNVDKISYVVYGKSLQTEGTLPGEKGKPALLNGTYEWYYKSGQIHIRISFKNGFRSGKGFYYYRTGYYSEVIDFDNTYEDQPFTYFLEAYQNNGHKYAEGYWRNGDRGWMGYMDYD